MFTTRNNLVSIFDVGYGWRYYHYYLGTFAWLPCPYAPFLNILTAVPPWSCSSPYSGSDGSHDTLSMIPDVPFLTWKVVDNISGIDPKVLLCLPLRRSSESVMDGPESHLPTHPSLDMGVHLDLSVVHCDRRRGVFQCLPASGLLKRSQNAWSFRNRENLLSFRTDIKSDF